MIQVMKMSRLCGRGLRCFSDQYNKLAICSRGNPTNRMEKNVFTAAGSISKYILK